MQQDMQNQTPSTDQAQAAAPAQAPVADQAAPAPAQPQATISGTTATKQIGKYKVDVIRDKCISAASCVAIAPAVFDLDEQQIAVILDQNGNDDDTKLLAAQSCPTAAIIVTNTETGEQVWPL